MSEKEKNAKLKALQLTLDKMEKSYGKGTIMRLGDKPVENIDAIPTGSLGLDIALGIGGYPRGRVIEIYGPESSGKTTLAIHAIAQAQAQGDAQVKIEEAKAQAEQIKTDSKIQVSNAENEFDIKKLEVEARTKRELMQFEYDLNVQLKALELQAQKELVEKQNATKEKIAVSKIQGPPKTEKPKKSFESKGNDVLGGFDLSRFEPK